MNTKKFLKMLFDGYVKCFPSFNWHTSSNYTDITMAELNHFSVLGEKLGFTVRREMNWHFPRDLCWVESNDPSQEAFLYMERENKDSRMTHTIEKMLNPDNAKDVKILVASFGHLKEKSFAEASKKLLNGLLPHQSALLFAWVGETENASHFIVKAHIIADGGVSEYVATPFIGRDNYWNISSKEA